MKDNKIYSVYCHTCNNMQYFGVTKGVKRRWFPSMYKGTSLKPYIEQFGWENIKHEVLFSCLTRDEALKKEDELICKARENGTAINTNRSGHYQQTEEYKEKHKDSLSTWNKTHQDYRNEYGKTWRETHPEERKAYGKAWREANPDYNKSYYEENKDRINARRRERYRLKKLEKQQNEKDINNNNHSNNPRKLF